MFCAYVSLSERRSSASSSGVRRRAVTFGQECAVRFCVAAPAERDKVHFVIRAADRARHGVMDLQPANVVAKGAAVARRGDRRRGAWRRECWQRW